MIASKILIIGGVSRQPSAAVAQHTLSAERECENNEADGTDKRGQLRHLRGESDNHHRVGKRSTGGERVERVGRAGNGRYRAVARTAHSRHAHLYRHFLCRYRRVQYHDPNHHVSNTWIE